MIAVALCIAAFVVTYLASTKSLVTGLGVLLAIGYLYGILRANIPLTASHFIFDSAVTGLYSVHLLRPLSTAERARLVGLRTWVSVLIGWPLVLFLVPIQPLLVQTVGLRGSILLLPFLLLGARLSTDEMRRLALWCAILILGAFGFALAEYFIGVQAFFPENAVTEIIYKSRAIDTMVGPGTPLRIPATFANAHSYAGAMVITLPILLGVWADGRLATWQRRLFAAAVLAAILGVFMAATRLHAILLFFLLFMTNVTRRVTLRARVGWAVIILIAGTIVAQDERLQRFRTLEDVDYVADRVQSSVNESFMDMAARYPMGNGLGGGGTSMPYFLRDQVRDLAMIENEYARIMLEQGIPGLIMWVAFIAWLLLSPRRTEGDLPVGRRLAWYAIAANLTTGLIGIGLFTAVPLTCVLLLLAGWIAPVPRASPVGSRASLARPPLRSAAQPL